MGLNTHTEHTEQMERIPRQQITHSMRSIFEQEFNAPGILGKSDDASRCVDSSSVMRR